MSPPTQGPLRRGAQVGRRHWRMVPRARDFWGSVGLTLLAVAIAIFVMGVMG